VVVARPPSASADPITVERPLVNGLRSVPSIASGDGVTVWTRGPRLWIGGEVRPARRVAPSRSVRILWDAGRTTGGRKVALVDIAGRRETQVMDLSSGRSVPLRVPRRVRQWTRVALDGGRIVFVTGYDGRVRDGIWTARLGAGGRVTALRRFGSPPPSVEITGLHAEAGLIGVDTFDGDETEEAGPRTESFLSTPGGRLRSVGSARETISGTAGTIGIVGLLPGGAGAVVRRVSGGEYGENSTLSVVSADLRRRGPVISADPIATAVYFGWQDGAIDSAGRLLVATKAVAAGQPDENDDPSDAVAVPASMLLSTPIALPPK
jgi:hypothetical protein